MYANQWIFTIERAAECDADIVADLMAGNDITILPKLSRWPWHTGEKWCRLPVNAKDYYEVR
jgi:hypothetical protein